MFHIVPYGIDYIIDEQGSIYLIEINDSPDVGKLIDKLKKEEPNLYQAFTSQRYLGEPFMALRKVLYDKWRTYLLLERYQPKTYLYGGAKDLSWRDWMATLNSKRIVRKPRRSSCSKGVQIHETAQLQATDRLITFGQDVILQEFIESRDIVLENNKFQGCIRHLIAIDPTTEPLVLYHLPSTWKVALQDKDQNIQSRSWIASVTSLNSMELPVTQYEQGLIQAITKSIMKFLLSAFLQRPITLQNVYIPLDLLLNKK